MNGLTSTQCGAGTVYPSGALEFTRFLMESLFFIFMWVCLYWLVCVLISLYFKTTWFSFYIDLQFYFILRFGIFCLFRLLKYILYYIVKEYKFWKLVWQIGDWLIAIYSCTWNCNTPYINRIHRLNVITNKTPNVMNEFVHQNPHVKRWIRPGISEVENI